LFDAGYRVLPQYEVAAARIDLMVEGLRSRLAIECNGEYWHGPDRWEQDQVRQRRLERAGLKFFTVWESAFRRDADETLEPLWHVLEQMGIQPLGSGESVVLDMDGYVPTESVSDSKNSASEENEVDINGAAAATSTVSTGSPAPGTAQTTSSEPSANVDADADGATRASSPPLSEIADPDTPLFAAASSPAPAGVEQYVAWQPRALPDPRIAHARDLTDGLKEIIAAEGPVLCNRAYQQFARAAGVMKLHSTTRGRFNQAIQKGVNAGLFELSDGYGTQYQMNRFVRLKGTPLVKLRTLGPRTIHEVPPEELAAMMRQIAEKSQTATREQLFRLVLDAYGLVRATEQTLATLDEARRRLRPPLD
jgi:very-short-patch-repair endonuclease